MWRSQKGCICQGFVNNVFAKLASRYNSKKHNLVVDASEAGSFNHHFSYQVRIFKRGNICLDGILLFGASWSVSFRCTEVASDDCHSPAVIIPSRAGVGSGLEDSAFNQKSIVVRLCLPLYLTQ